ncbi:hypothetical protein PCANC_16689 [Puccinia coronata f. sp. avenae]|uniref:Uncharacterized protein n=1 Tax=Puccinia coronata f. sp. avenae TaxID=200324 RepID=A0A2N5SJ93_9BASI|nr:hypothetical protein PCANC_16689 [Puccinia coronata f. sp. avenae]
MANLMYALINNNAPNERKHNLNWEPTTMHIRPRNQSLASFQFWEELSRKKNQKNLRCL